MDSQSSRPPRALAGLGAPLFLHTTRPRWQETPQLWLKPLLYQLTAQLVKNPPAMQETPVQFLGQGRSTGERIGYPLQFSWAFLVVQLVKNMPAMRETWVRSLGWEDLLEKGKATHSSALA